VIGIKAWGAKVSRVQLGRRDEPLFVSSSPYALQIAWR
jgi:hypothetical protein